MSALPSPAISQSVFYVRHSAQSVSGRWCKEMENLSSLTFLPTWAASLYPAMFAYTFPARADHKLPARPTRKFPARAAPQTPSYSCL